MYNIHAISKAISKVLVKDKFDITNDQLHNKKRISW